jgi:hypothetical protein
VTSPRAAEIVVCDRGVSIAFSFGDLMRYHGPGSPGGVAHAFKVLERVLPLLDADGPAERREISVRTAFGGPGARDGFEMATRAVTEDRYAVDRTLRRPELGPARERFVFELGYRGRSVTVAVREGFVTDEFAGLAFKGERTRDEAERLDVLKQEMAERVMAAPAAGVYDVVDG